MPFVVLVDLHAKRRRSRQKGNLLLWPTHNLHVILKLSKHPCRQSMQVGAKKQSYGVSAPIRPAFHTSKYARNICWISSGWACSLVWLERCWMRLLRALGGKLSPRSVVRSPQTGERGRVFSRFRTRLLLTGFLFDRRYSVSCRPAFFLLTVCVWRLVQEMRKTRQLVRGEGWVCAALKRPFWTRSLVQHHPLGCKDVCVWIPSVNNASLAMQTTMFLVRTEYFFVEFDHEWYLNIMVWPHSDITISRIMYYWSLWVLSSSCIWMFTMHSILTVLHCTVINPVFFRPFHQFYWWSSWISKFE